MRLQWERAIVIYVRNQRLYKAIVCIVLIMATMWNRVILYIFITLATLYTQTVVMQLLLQMFIISCLHRRHMVSNSREEHSRNWCSRASKPIRLQAWAKALNADHLWLNSPLVRLQHRTHEDMAQNPPALYRSVNVYITIVTTIRNLYLTHRARNKMFAMARELLLITSSWLNISNLFCPLPRFYSIWYNLRLANEYDNTLSKPLMTQIKQIFVTAHNVLMDVEG